MSGEGAGSRLHASTDPGAGRGEPLGATERLKRLARAALAPVTGLLVSAGVRPDHLTAAGLLVSLGAAVAFFEGGFRLGALLLATAGVCDILDGEVARRLGGTSRFGAFLDSTFDRLADALVLAGIAGYYLEHLVEQATSPQLTLADISRGLGPPTWALVSLTASAAMIGSFLVSYARARAEGLGLACRVGWFERPQRTALLILAGAFGVGPWMSGALLLLVLLSFVTATQRIVYVWKITRGAGADG